MSHPGPGEASRSPTAFATVFTISTALALNVRAFVNLFELV